MNIRVRFAPSPTGFLHIGGLRTALYNELFAKNQGGKFILRIEDTDRERFVDGSIESLVSVFARLKIEFDEGPKLENNKIVQVGNYGPYIQSERLPIYKKYVDELVQNKHAYYCFCCTEDLASQRKEQEALKMPTKYNRHCAHLSAEEIQIKLEAKEPYVIRLRVPEGKTTFEDIIRGSITISHEEVDDQVLLKSDGFPTYHLAVVVDDHLMEITHVLRAEEWIPSTPKHILLYQMFGWEIPKFAHLPQLLNADRSKLSKRQGDVACEDYLEKGYLPEALINFLALLGYNPKGDQEVYKKEELVSLFDLSKVNPSGAIVNFEKLNWMNQVYIKQKSAKELAELCRPFLERAGKSVEQNLLLRIMSVERYRMTTLAECVTLVDSYQKLEAYDPALLVWKKSDANDAKIQLLAVQSVLEGLKENEFTLEGLEIAIKAFISTQGLQNGNVLWPMRVALSGKSQSPGPFELAFALGKKESLQRLATAINLLS